MSADKPVERLRACRPLVFRTSLIWALLAGAGASLLGMKLAAAVLFSLYSESAILPEYWLGPLPIHWTQFVGAALGVGVSLLAGGRVAVLLFLAFNLIVIGPLLVREAVAPVCGGAEFLCPPSDLVSATLANWPFAVGALVGVGTADLVARSGPVGTNPLLEVAGVHASSTWLLFTAIALLLPPAPELAYTQVGVTGLIATCATAITSVFRSRRPVRDVVLIAVALVAANAPGAIEQIKQWLYFGVIDSSVMNSAALGTLSALLLVPLTALARYLVIEPRAPRVQWIPEKGGQP